MKKVIDQLRLFVAQYSIWHWISVFAFCGITLFINYSLGLKAYLKSLTGFSDFLAGTLLYGSHFLGGFAIHSVFTKQKQFWYTPRFWWAVLAALVIFSFRESVDFYYQWIATYSTNEMVSANQTTFKYVFRMSLLFVPVLGYWFWFDRKNEPFYGFSGKKVDYKLYFLLLLCMVPLIVFASTQTDFLSYYPRAKRLTDYNLPLWRYLLFETCYAIDFIGIELFFRGFLIMAFTRVVGIHAVLPMACFYLSIHFGKPMGEALSSFFGGTILGVIAFNTRSIYGGILVHVGVAWLMEIGGFLGNLLQGN